MRLGEGPLDYSREAIATEVGSSMPGLRVVRVPEQIASTRPLPTTIVCDNGHRWPLSGAGQREPSRAQLVEGIVPNTAIDSAGISS